MSTELKAPHGKTRVVGVNLFRCTNYLVGDYNDKETAFEIVDNHNKNRSESIDDVYHVYNDKGKHIRGNEEIGQSISP